MRIIKRIILLMLLASSSFSATAWAVPSSCPSVEAIRAAGVGGPRAVWTSFAFDQRSNYNTEVSWHFTLELHGERNHDKLRAMANEALRTLKFEKGPEHFWQGKYMCRYKCAFCDGDAIAFEQ